MPWGTLKVSVSAGGTCQGPPLSLHLDGAPETVLGNLVPPESPWAPKGDIRAVPALPEGRSVASSPVPEALQEHPRVGQGDQGTAVWQGKLLTLP